MRHRWSTFPKFSRLLKGGLVVLAPGGTTIRRVIALQYNPDTLTRSYQIQGVGGEGEGGRAQPFRFRDSRCDIREKKLGSASNCFSSPRFEGSS